jgi:hypothetical protein
VQGANMNVTLKKKITLKSATVYLKMQKKVKREDIQIYLQGKRFKNAIVEDRVQDYLKNIRIYNEQYHLTPYGNEVKETGMVNEDEEGKYLIWFTQNDSLFGSRIFYFRRIKPESYNQQLNQLELNFSGQTFLSLPVQGQDSTEFSIMGAVNKYPSESKSDENIFCTWIWNDTQSSFFFFVCKFGTTHPKHYSELE